MADDIDPKYKYTRFGSNASRVGQASLDILSKDNPVTTAGDVMEGMAPKFVEEMEKAVESGAAQYKDPFYILVLTKKEYLIINAMRNFFIPRQTAPYALGLMEQYPNHVKSLYAVRYEQGDIQLAWSLPAFGDCISILKTPLTYSPELVGWVFDCFNGKLEKDSYDELFS